MNPESLQTEIKELEAKLHAKKQEVAESGKEVSENLVFKQVFKEHAGGSESSSVSVPISSSQTSNTQAPTREVTKEDEEKINLLIAHSFTKGVKDAISEAKKTNDPFFLDILHDRLANEYYEKLVTARKVNSQ